VRLAILAIVMETLRRLHVYFLSSANNAPNMDWSPHIGDMLDARGSIVVNVLQYYSALLHGIGSRLRLIWHVFGKYRSAAEWSVGQRVAPENLVIHWRHCILLAFSQRCTQTSSIPECVWPWRLLLFCMLGDSSTTAEQRADCVTVFLKTRPCCMPPGLARRLRGRAREICCWETCLRWRAVELGGS
jgi:hypothetical protein